MSSNLWYKLIMQKKRFIQCKQYFIKLMTTSYICTSKIDEAKKRRLVVKEGTEIMA